MRKRLRLRISGRVQGVFFRVACREQANGLGLVGWVRNLSNSDVEVLAEGCVVDVDVLQDWCRAGPSNARVDDVTVSEEAPLGDMDQFSVIRDA